jgi:hypothetical protein
MNDGSVCVAELLAVGMANMETVEVAAQVFAPHEDFGQCVIRHGTLACQRSAVSGQRSAVSGQRSAVSGKLEQAIIVYKDVCTGRHALRRASRCMLG